MQTHNIQSYLSPGNRRAFTPEEQSNIDASLRGNWIGKIFESYGTPAHENLASPGKAAIMAALVGGGLGGIGGAALGGNTNSGAGVTAGALLGAGLGSSAAGLLAYYLRNQSNENLLELMRRSPENPTLRDVWSDPLLQEDVRRQRQTGDVSGSFLGSLAANALARQ